MSSSQFQLHGCNLTVRNVLSILSLGVLFPLRDFTLLEPSCWTREHESRLQESRGTSESFLFSLFFLLPERTFIRCQNMYTLAVKRHRSCHVHTFMAISFCDIYVSSPDLFRLLLISIVPPPINLVLDGL